MRTTYRRMAGLPLALCLLLTGPALVYAADRLPDEVRESIRKAFPSAIVTGYGRETENGVRFYEVNLRQSDLRIEVEVDKYGGIGEIERRVSLNEAPQELLDAIAKVADKNGPIRVERHERWGVARNGRFVALQIPRVFYEVKLRIRGQRRELQWRPQRPNDLPELVDEAVKEKFPRAVITEAEKENEDGVELYQIAVIQDGGDTEMTLSPNGVVVEIETRISRRDLPQAVSAAVAGTVGRGRLGKVTRLDVHALTDTGNLVELDRPRQLYEVQYVPTGGKGKVETLFSADGIVMESDTRIPLTEVPRAVINTVAKEAEGAKITKAEKETVYALLKPAGVVRLSPPRVVYDLELARNGQEGEIEVLANGTLAQPPQWDADDEDDDDNDDDGDNDDD